LPLLFAPCLHRHPPPPSPHLPHQRNLHRLRLPLPPVALPCPPSCPAPPFLASRSRQHSSSKALSFSVEASWELPLSLPRVASTAIWRGALLDLLALGYLLTEPPSLLPAPPHLQIQALKVFWHHMHFAFLPNLPQAVSFPAPVARVWPSPVPFFVCCPRPPLPHLSAAALNPSQDRRRNLRQASRWHFSAADQPGLTAAADRVQGPPHLQQT